jgi:hypothetical protein
MTRFQTHLSRALLVSLLGFGLSWGFAAHARADSDVVTGTGTVPSATASVTITSSRQVGSNTLFTSSGAYVEFGVETGSCTSAFEGVIFADGSGNFHGMETCTGTIAGHAGSWQIDPGVGTIAPDGSLAAHEVIHGLGNIQYVHGLRTFTGPAVGDSFFTDTLNIGD